VTHSTYGIDQFTATPGQPKQLKTWLKAGVTVELRERDKSRPHRARRTPGKAPSKLAGFCGAAQGNFGDRVYPELIC